VNGETMRCSLDSTLESIARAESLVAKHARRAGFRGASLDQIHLAVHETAANAVIHGNRLAPEKKILLAISVNDHRFTVTIGDEGEGFDPDGMPSPVEPQELLREHGRGIFLSRACMDEYQVQRRETGGTEVTLIKHLPQPE
jgi:serine/threonine-protein kinase RsbW